MPAEMPTTAILAEVWKSFVEQAPTAGARNHAMRIHQRLCAIAEQPAGMTTPREVFRFEGTAGNRVQVMVWGCVTEDILETIDAFIAMPRKGKSAKVQEHPYVV